MADLYKCETPNPAEYNYYALAIRGVHKHTLFYIDGSEVDSEKKGYVIGFPVDARGATLFYNGYYIIKAIDLIELPLTR